MTLDIDFSQAEIIVNDYGKLLAETEPSIYGSPASLLPHEKEDIKAAIQTLLLNIEQDNPAIINGLAQAYIYIAQFIPDDKYQVAQDGKKILEKNDGENLERANDAIQIINAIKADMETLMNEIRILLGTHTPNL